MATTARGYPYPIAGDPADGAGNLNALATAIDADVTALGTWTSYTPTWTASAGAPSIGNGTLSGRYVRVNKKVDFSVYLLAGTTTTYGTAGAYWILGLPALGNAARHFAFALRMTDASVLEYAGIAATVAGAATVELFKPVSGRIVNNSPFTFGTGDELWFNGTYELI